MNTGVWASIGLSGILLKVAFAIVIVIVTWIVARVIRWLVTKLVAHLAFLRRSGADGQQIGETLGRVVGLLVWLFGLIALLQLFGLTQVVAPLQGMLGGVFGFLPNLLGAAFVFFIGYVFATIVRQLIVVALGAIDFARLSSRVTSLGRRASGVHAEPGTDASSTDAGATAVIADRQTIPSVVGSVVFGIILFLVAISALQVLGLKAISEPAQQLLTGVLNALPAILGAAIVLALGVAIAVFIGRLLRTIVPAKGLATAARTAGIDVDGVQVSVAISRIVEIAVMVFFGIIAAQLLGFPQITNLLNTVLAIAGRIVFGAAIIAVGFLVAGIIGRFVTQTMANRIVRYTTIALFAAMGLKYMGLADSIVNLAFGAVVIGGALAAALAFGLGGRDAAARALDRLESRARAQSYVSAAAESTAQAPGGDQQ